MTKIAIIVKSKVLTSLSFILNQFSMFLDSSFILLTNTFLSFVSLKLKDLNDKLI